MQNLLDSIGAIHHKYKMLEKQEGFNIFSVLRSYSDEVRVHSRFIAELLNPRGSHGQGTVFLDHFLTLLKLAPLEYTKAEVQKEHKNIDILIRLDNKALIIENKIWASDRKHQLQNYYEVMREEGYRNEDIKVIYLTLGGRGSTAYNRGSLEKNLIQLLSYKSDILQWLEACQRETAKRPILHQTMQQYEDIIRQLTGNTMRDNERAEVIELLRTEDNMLKAAKIVEAWDEIRIKAEWNFWKELKALIKDEGQYPILSTREVDHKFVSNQVTGKKKGSSSYGIMLQLATSGPDKICLYIQRGKNDMYYGITALDEKGNREISCTPKYLSLAHSIRHLNDKQEQRWIGKKYFSKPINFSIFRNEATLRLIQPDFRQDYVKALWDEVKAYIKACNPEIVAHNTDSVPSQL